MLKIAIILCYLFVSIQCPDPCGDWNKYEDKKCFKVLPETASYEGADIKCFQSSFDSTLVTIHDLEEQQFINKLIEPFDNISMNAWTGMQYNGQEYDWMDGTDSNFTNWSEEAETDVFNELCVQMSLSKGTVGKWTDSSCNREALIVCQRNQTLSLNSMKDIIEDILQTIDYQNIEFKQKTEGFENTINSLAENIENIRSDIESIKTQINSNNQDRTNSYTESSSVSERQVFRHCTQNLFDCGNSRCVDLHLLCNGVDNCGNGADEYNCKYSPRIPVPQHCYGKFFCYDKDNTCVPNNVVCNGYADCPNNYDEQYCRKKQYYLGP